MYLFAPTNKYIVILAGLHPKGGYCDCSMPSPANHLVRGMLSSKNQGPDANVFVVILAARIVNPVLSSTLRKLFANALFIHVGAISDCLIGFSWSSLISLCMNLGLKFSNSGSAPHHLWASIDLGKAQ